MRASHVHMLAIRVSTAGKSNMKDIIYAKKVTDISLHCIGGHPGGRGYLQAEGRKKPPDTSPIRQSGQIKIRYGYRCHK